MGVRQGRLRHSAIHSISDRLRGNSFDYKDRARWDYFILTPENQKDDLEQPSYITIIRHFLWRWATYMHVHALGVSNM